MRKMNLRSCGIGRLVSFVSPNKRVEMKTGIEGQNWGQRIHSSLAWTGRFHKGEKIVLLRPNSCIIWFTEFSFDSPTFLHKMHRFATLFIGFLYDSVA